MRHHMCDTLGWFILCLWSKCLLMIISNIILLNDLTKKLSFKIFWIDVLLFWMTSLLIIGNKYYWLKDEHMWMHEKNLILNFILLYHWLINT